ncbi:hypothetical protein [Agromyces laixinhei]|uniref:hypothetical protein n=1 Tax=Agromyces laixinhei TaxID=2585717 RepID=UPI0012ED0DA9
MVATSGRNGTALHKLLFARGYRDRINDRPLPNIQRTANIAFPLQRIAIIVDGCFWHGCPKRLCA